jgi:serine phosphatase RsbU (regulator of sigma subunit)
MQLLEPSQMPTTTPTFTTVPGVWRGSGFATYRLQILLPPGDHRLSLRLLTVSTAYRLYVDGELAAAVGRVSAEPEQSRPEYKTLIVDVDDRKRESLELVVQVSNFHYAKGGIWEGIYLGDPESTRRLREENVGLESFLVGSFGIIGLYHVFIWLVRRSERSALYFAVMCFAVAARILTVDDTMITSLWPGIPWSVHVKIEYASLSIMAACLIPFLRTLFPEEVPVGLVVPAATTGLVLAVFVALTSPALFSRALQLQLIYWVGMCFLGPALALRAAARGRRDARPFVLGLGAAMVASVHDTLLTVLRDLPTMQFLGGSIYLQPFMLFVSLLTQAIVLAMRYSGAYVQLERASAELSDAHAELDTRARELEQRVAARTADLALANDRLQKEISLARLVQVALLPENLPEIPGYTLFATNEPSRLVSGDFYEVHRRVGTGEPVLVIADVSGKGMAASLLAASLDALLIGPIEGGYSTNSICERVGRRLHARTPPERYATAIIASLSPREGVLTYSNAGHNPGLLVRASGSSERLGTTGVPLGLFPSAEYESVSVALAPGDLVVFYTDGITEAVNDEGEEFSLLRLERVVKASAASTLGSVALAIEGAVEAFAGDRRFADDRTLLLLRRELEDVVRPAAGQATGSAALPE